MMMSDLGAAHTGKKLFRIVGEHSRLIAVELPMIDPRHVKAGRQRIS
jgi:hypothetical protein